MARSSSNVASSDVVKALQIEGYTVKEARKLVALAKKVSDLGPKQTIIKASELTEEHVGMLLKIGSGETRVINDVDEPRPQRGMQYGYNRLATVVDGPEFDGDEVNVIQQSRPNHRAVTVVLESKLAKIPWNTLVVLTDPSAN